MNISLHDESSSARKYFNRKSILLKSLLDSLTTAKEYLNFEIPMRFLPFLERAERISNILTRFDNKFPSIQNEEFNSIILEASKIQMEINNILLKFSKTAKDDLNQYLISFQLESHLLGNKK